MTTTYLDSYSFAFNDFVFGGGNSPYQILSVDGLDALPTIRVQDDNRGYADGTFSGRDFLSGRSILMTVQVTAGSYDSLQTALQAFMTALIPQQQGTSTLNFQIPGRALQQVSARVRRRAVQINPTYTYGLAIVTLEFYCPSAQYFDAALQTTNIFGAARRGRTYNRTYNMSYGGGTARDNQISNSGWATTYPIFTITGPAVNPVITNSNTGQFLKFNVTLISGDVLVVDTDLRTVTLNGANRRALMDNSSSWFAVNSGSIYVFMTASGTNGNTSCTTQWRNAYI